MQRSKQLSIHRTYPVYIGLCVWICILNLIHKGEIIRISQNPRLKFRLSSSAEMFCRFSILTICDVLSYLNKLNLCFFEITLNDSLGTREKIRSFKKKLINFFKVDAVNLNKIALYLNRSLFVGGSMLKDEFSIILTIWKKNNSLRYYNYITISRFAFLSISTLLLWKFLISDRLIFLKYPNYSY